MLQPNNDLQIGDIILVRGGTKTSRIIANRTDGDFSHAMLVINQSRTLEAITASGVQVTSNIRLLFKDRKNVAILRYRFPDEITQKELHAFITDNYQDYQGREYSYSGALRAISKSNKDLTKGRFFCSHLVADIFNRAGLNLLNKEPHKATPNDFLRSTYLEDITDETLSHFSEVAMKRIENSEKDLKCLDDGGETTSQDARNNNKLLNTCAKHFKKFGVSPPSRTQAFIDILTQPQNVNFAFDLDKLISREYKKIDINKYLEYELKKPNFEQDYNVMVNEIEKHGYQHAVDMYCSYAYFIEEMTSKCNNHKQLRHLFKAVHDKYGLKYSWLRYQYYDLIVKMSENNLAYFKDVCDFILSSFPEKNTELTRQAADAIALMIDKNKTT